MKLLLLLLFSLTTFAQAPQIYGLWYNAEGEFVKIFQNDTFNRFIVEVGTRKKITVSTGTIEYVNKELRIVRKDTVDSYNLCYYIGNETMVVCRPRSQEAWLWQKVSD
jgi:hypothetical protein|tara:strand:+ start:245 stop:568 length:324 start_codon:yes stop_codon:yes gene_type:complete